MTQKILARSAGALVVAALLATSGIAFAQTYDYGASGAASGSAGSIVPVSNNTTGVTEPMGTGASVSASSSNTPGVPNTGTTGTNSTTPGVPNTGAGDPTTWLVLAASGLIALGAVGYLARRFAVR